MVSSLSSCTGYWYMLGKICESMSLQALYYLIEVAAWSPFFYWNLYVTVFVTNYKLISLHVLKPFYLFMLSSFYTTSCATVWPLLALMNFLNIYKNGTNFLLFSFCCSVLQFQQQFISMVYLPFFLAKFIAYLLLILALSICFEIATHYSKYSLFITLLIDPKSLNMIDTFISSSFDYLIASYIGRFSEPCSILHWNLFLHRVVKSSMVLAQLHTALFRFLEAFSAMYMNAWTAI